MRYDDLTPADIAILTDAHEAGLDAGESDDGIVDRMSYAIQPQCGGDPDQADYIARRFYDESNSMFPKKENR